MSSVAPISSASSPKKKGGRKSKHRSSNDDLASRSTKAQRVQNRGNHSTRSLAIEQHRSKSQSAIITQESRHTGRAGAGSGGKVQQLQKIRAILEGQVVRSHKATDLPESMASNPLAPPAKHTRSGAWHSSGKKAGLDVTLPFFKNLIPWLTLCDRSPLHMYRLPQVKFTHWLQ